MASSLTVSGPSIDDSAWDEVVTINWADFTTTVGEYETCPSEEGEPEPPGCVLYSFVIYTVIVGLLGLFGTIGNMISFIVFLKDKIKTSTSFLFQALSVIDTLMLITVFPMYFMPNLVIYTGWYQEYQNSGYQLVLVHLLPFIFTVQMATIWVTVLVGINRYIAVCMPYQAVRLCTVAQAKRQLAIVMTLVVVYNVPKFAEGRLETYPGTNNRSLTCAIHTELLDNDYYKIGYGNISYCVFMLIVPLATLTILNLRLIAALKDVNQKRREMQSARQQQDNNVTLVLIVVVIVFSVCQFPALVTQISWNILPDPSRHCGGFQFYFSRISNALVIANSAVNFLIYFRFNKRFRSTLWKLVTGTLDSQPTGLAALAMSRRSPLTTDTATTLKRPSVAVTALGSAASNPVAPVNVVPPTFYRSPASTQLLPSTDGRCPPVESALGANSSPSSKLTDDNDLKLAAVPYSETTPSFDKQTCTSSI